jgi:hypothetical protein
MGSRLPPAAPALVPSMAEREQAERYEQQWQKEDVSAGEGEHNQRYGYADGKGAQHVRLLSL